MKCFVGVFLVVFSLLSQKAFSCENSPRKHTRFADFGKTAMPITTYGIAAIHGDWLGLGISAVLINGLYALNNPLEKKIHKERPCGCDGSFPSGHMIMYASSASFLHYRYGWQYGFPAYIASFVFAADRVNNKAHDWDDMVGTFLIVNLISYLVVPRFNDEVEYLPPSWITYRQKEKKYREMRYHQLTRYEHKLDLLPFGMASKNSFILGFSMKF